MTQPVNIQSRHESAPAPPASAGGAPGLDFDLGGLPDGSQRIKLGSGEITSLLSKGGTAVVYEIWNPELEVHRAVKLLHPDSVAESRERFETEIKITAKLHHPNIVEIYAVGQWNGQPYIEMERVDGWTLDKILQERGALPVEVCTAIGVMVSRALYYAHNENYMIFGKEYHGIIHRDLKPGNVMLGKNGRVKLMDFGIAKPMSATGRTVEGMVVGTMQYLSPEQLQGGRVDTRSDIYSFGTVLYELLTGTRTFPEENLAKLVTDKLNNNYRGLDRFGIRLPPKLRTLSHRCLYYEMHKRIRSALALVKNLEALHEEISDESPEEILRTYMAKKPRVRRVVAVRGTPSRVAVIAPVAAAVLAIGALVFLTAYIRSKLAPYSAPPEPRSTEVIRPPTPTPREREPRQTRPRQPSPGPRTSPTPVARPKLAGTSRQPDAHSERVARPEETAPVRPASAEPEQPAPQKPPPRRNPTLLQRMAAKHGTSDVLALVQAEYGEKNYRNALRLYRHMPQKQAREVKAQLTRLHVLQDYGNRKKLVNFLLSQDIDDGEFYIEKALHFCRTGSIEKARRYYDKSMKTPGRYADPAELKRSRLYCKARIATAVFNDEPSATNKKNAMDSWYEIKLQLRTSPDHPLFTRADTEIRRISNASVTP